jgi:predicted nucleic acid-binding protein
VSDAGPLIALSKINRLDLLECLFDQILVPDIVLQELRLDEHRPGVSALRNAFAGSDKWVSRTTSGRLDSDRVLDPGEHAAILIAKTEMCPLLIDETRGRRFARKQGVPVVGTGRILLEAKTRGLIPDVSGLLYALSEVGCRLSKELITRLSELAGE